jgi:hypothetical protein
LPSNIASPAVATTAPVVATAAAPPPKPAPVLAPPSTHDGNDPAAASPSPPTLNDVIAHAIDGIGAHTQEVPAKFPSEVLQSQHNPTVNCYFAPGVLNDLVPPVPAGTQSFASSAETSESMPELIPGHMMGASTISSASTSGSSITTCGSIVNNVEVRGRPHSPTSSTLSTPSSLPSLVDPRSILSTGTDTAASTANSETKQNEKLVVKKSTPPTYLPPACATLASADAVAAATNFTEGALFAEGTTNHSRKYTNRKKKLLNEFVEVLKRHPKKYARFLVLADKVPISFPTSEPTEMVFVLLRGEENRTEKVRSLNGMLIDWVSEKKLKKPPREGGSYYPAPASLNTMVRTFFASAKDYYQWSFSQKDFSFDGGYNGFFAALCKKRREEDVSFFVLFFFRQFFRKLFLTQSIQTTIYNSQSMETNPETSI